MRKYGIVFTVTVVFSLLAASQSHADTTYWQGTTGSWDNSANWDNGIPTSADYAYIKNDGTAQITSGISAASYVLCVGMGGAPVTYGAVTQSGGTNTVDFSLEISEDSSYTLSGGDLLSSGDTDIFYGEFIQTGGTHTVADYLYLYSDIGVAGYTLDDGELTVGLGIGEGIDVTGEFIQNGGSCTAGSIDLFDGTYTLNGGDLETTNNPLSLMGGDFTQTGGIVDAHNIAIYGGTYEFTGGSIETGDIGITNGLMDIDVSEITYFRVLGDAVSKLNGYIDNNKIYDSTLAPDTYLYAVYDSGNEWTTLDIGIIPEPGTIALISCALAAMAGVVRKKFR